MDLSAIDTKAAAEAGAVMELKHPATGDVIRKPETSDTPAGQDPPPVTMTLAGQDSERHKRARNAAVTKRLARRNPGKITGEDADAENLDVLVACVISWDGIVDNGEPLDCTAKNVRRIFEKYPWAREQAEQFIADRANYLGN